MVILNDEQPRSGHLAPCKSRRCRYSIKRQPATNGFEPGLSLGGDTEGPAVDPRALADRAATAEQRSRRCVCRRRAPTRV